MGENDCKEFAEVLSDERKVLRPGGAEQPLSALCISGGGIRSATFGLGALQGLAEQGVLADFDYLSTVSGGGYIGAWLTAWKERAQGMSNVVPRLKPGCAPLPNGVVDPIEHLREYNNYLSPKSGFFSADTWTLATTVLTNMTLNWLVLIPLLMFALTIPRLVLSLGLLKDQSNAMYNFTFPETLATPVALIGAFFFALSIFNTMRYLPGVGGRNHTETDFVRWCLIPLFLATIGFMSYDSWFDTQVPAYTDMVEAFTAAAAAGWLGFLIICPSGLKRRLQLLFGWLSVAIALLGIGTASAAWVLVAKFYSTTSWSVYTSIGPPLVLLGFMSASGLFIGLTSRALGDADREWLSRGGAWVLLCMVCWAGVGVLVLIAPKWLFHAERWIQSSVAAAGGLGGWIASRAGFSSRSSSPGKKEGGGTPDLKNVPLDVVARVAAPVFVGVLLAGIAILTNWLMWVVRLVSVDWTGHDAFLENSRADFIALTALVFLGLATVAARFINVNKFSLHAMYRNRLIRAYLGASTERSKVNRFIDFSDSDNIYMGKLTPEMKPFHVVNTTLNLVGGKNLAWQQRKAESFTISALHAGSADLGYRASARYGGPHGISLGTAITISGAAVSPSMGYHSSAVIGFIMTLFNARLGAWLGNPGWAGGKTWPKDGPSSAVNSLVREAFGLTNATSPYVYLSDGGHFENLGLYEMVKRRCHRIVVLDAGCDAEFTFEDQGNAWRKIRIDTGISIDLRMKCQKGTQRWGYAVIRYSEVDANAEDGQLIYIKPMMNGDESPDVTSYACAHKQFPHETTANQFYNESQTESYRMLGLHTIRTMCKGWERLGGLDAMFGYLQGVSATTMAAGSSHST